MKADPSNKEGTCLWCGRKLQHRYYHTPEVPLGPDERVKCKECGTWHKVRDLEVWNTLGHCPTCKSYVRSNRKDLKARERMYDAPGPRGDGYFCTLECSYRFAVVCARGGYRLKVMKA